MSLLLNGASMRIAEMGSDFLLIDADQSHNPCQATVILRVNTSERRWDVYLPHGIAAGGMQEVAVTFPAGQTVRQYTELKAVAGS